MNLKLRFFVILCAFSLSFVVHARNPRPQDLQLEGQLGFAQGDDDSTIALGGGIDYFVNRQISLSAGLLYARWTDEFGSVDFSTSLLILDVGPYGHFALNQNLFFDVGIRLGTGIFKVSIDGGDSNSFLAEADESSVVGSIAAGMSYYANSYMFGGELRVPAYSGDDVDFDGFYFALFKVGMAI